MANVLVVEDDVHIKRVVCMWLERQGHEVRGAVNGAQALELIEAEAPDVLITDVNMPGLDGLELLAELEKRGQMPRGVVVLTNRWDHKELGKSLSVPGAHVIPKPFSPTALAKLVSDLAATNQVESATPSGPAGDDA